MTRWRFIGWTPIQMKRSGLLRSVWVVRGVILVVVYTLRGGEIRFISARRATRQEVKDYEG